MHICRLVRRPSSSLAEIKSRLSFPGVSQSRLRSRVTINEPEKESVANEGEAPLVPEERSSLEFKRPSKIALPKNCETHFMQVWEEVCDKKACFIT